MANEDINEINTAISEHIVRVNAEKIAEIDEQVFVHRLLPLAVSHYSDIGVELELTLWQELTGFPPMFGVHVMRDGKRLMTTPPLILSPKLSMTQEPFIDRLNAIHQANAKNLPSKDLFDESNRPIIVVDGAANALNKWPLIFKFYGIQLILKTPEELEADKNPDKDKRSKVFPTKEEQATSVHKTVPPKEIVPKVQEWEDDEDDEML